MRLSLAPAIVPALSLALLACLPPADTIGGDQGVSDTDGGTEDAGDLGDPLPPNALPFDPIGPSSYVPKVKNLITGLPATDAEVQSVATASDPQAALRTLIDGWMVLPEFKPKAMDFFRNAFQQNQVDLRTLVANMGNAMPLINDAYQQRFEQSLMDSFPLTAWDLVSRGQPFNRTVTTNQYMLTTAQMIILSYLDENTVDDAGKRTSRLTQRAALAKLVLDPLSTATQAESLDPTSPNYMTWKLPITVPASCTSTPPVTYMNNNTYTMLLGVIMGKAEYAPCYPTGDTRFPPQLTDADWNDWHLVTIKPTSAAAPNPTPVFWDFPKMRTATEMTLRTPRIGFFGTLAFAANWGTNADNQLRVTANQTLIVAIGRSISGTNNLSPFTLASSDASHASSSECIGCHVQLDPFRQYFRQSYSYFYHDQVDATQASVPAGFAIDGVTATGTGKGVGELVDTLATHPRFSLAWVQKLHYWANNSAALENDPEMLRIAAAFVASNYDFKTLVRELFSSPLVTFAKGTSTTHTLGITLSIARRDQYCASLSNRLGLPDLCGFVTPVLSNAQKLVAGRAALIPVDTYYRAFELPSLATNPDLFFRSSVEALCRAVADQVVDAGATTRYSSAMATTAIVDFVTNVMGIVPSDARYQGAIDILTAHNAAARAAPINASAKDALKSTFTLACIAPSTVMVGL